MSYAALGYAGIIKVLVLCDAYEVAEVHEAPTA